MRNTTYIIGKPGTGKTTYLTRLFVETIRSGKGAAYFDFSGNVDRLLAFIPPKRITDTVLFCPADDREFPVGFNILEGDPTDVGDLVLDTIKSAYGYDSFPTPDLDIYLSASAATLAHLPDKTLIDIPRFLSDRTFRHACLSRVSNQGLIELWRDLYDPMPEKDRYQVSKSTLNKIYALSTDPVIRNIIGQMHTAFTLNDASIFVASFPPSMGERKTSVLASLVFSTMPPVLAILDGGNRIAPSVVLRHKGALVFSHQYTAELSDALRDTLIGTAATIVSFAVGPDDSRRLSPEFGIVQEGDMLHHFAPLTYRIRGPGQDSRHDYGVPSLDFPTYSATQVRNVCRTRYGSLRAHVEASIARFTLDGSPGTAQQSNPKQRRTRQ